MPDLVGVQGKIAMSPDQFEATVNELYDSGAHPLIEGYAPFCKHIFIPNFAGLECGYVYLTDRANDDCTHWSCITYTSDGGHSIDMSRRYIAITDSNRSLLRSEYKARTEKELPVLERWFPKDEVTAPEAKFLDIILYSRFVLCPMLFFYSPIVHSLWSTTGLGDGSVCVFLRRYLGLGNRSVRKTQPWEKTAGVMHLGV